MARFGSLSPRRCAASRVASAAALRASGFVDSAAPIFTPGSPAPISHSTSLSTVAAIMKSMRLRPSGVGSKHRESDAPRFLRVIRRSSCSCRTRMSEGLAQRDPGANRYGARGSSTTTEADESEGGPPDDGARRSDDGGRRSRVLGGIVPTAGEQRLEQHTNEHVDERYRHCSPSAHEWTEEDYEPWSERGFRVSAPFTVKGGGLEISESSLRLQILSPSRT